METLNLAVRNDLATPLPQPVPTSQDLICGFREARKRSDVLEETIPLFYVCPMDYGGTAEEHMVQENWSCVYSKVRPTWQNT
jgi:hypothetical protein